MAPARKDCKGRALKKGETQRKSDLMYIYTYMDPFTHKRKYVYSKDLLTLREKEKELQRDQLDGLDIYVAGSATLNYLFDRYIFTKTELRSSTRTNYTYMYDHYVRNSLGQKLIKDIKYSDIVRFYIYLINEMGLQVNTLETIHTVLNPTFKMAVRDSVIRINPCEGAMAQIKRKSKRNQGVRHALTLEQQRAFMRYIKDHPVFYRWEPLFTVLLGTGCRVGEVIGLRWKDIDFKKRMININHSVSYYPRVENSYKCEYRVSLPKTEAGIRNVPMMKEVCEAFLKEKARQKEEDLFNHMEVDGMSGFIFCNRFGKLHNPSSINRAIRRITETYNSEEVVTAKREGREPVILPHFSCHHLRHTFCTRFCENETNVKIIQSVMGHANIQTTLDIYAEVTEIKKSQSIEDLSCNLYVF